MSNWKNNVFETDNIRIQITNKHINYPNEWIMHVRELNWRCIPLGLKADEQAEIAQFEALKICALHTAKLISDIHKAMLS